ncbi:putative motility protein [Dermatophilus congolensis]|uniref:Motility protein n=1 Tax=Dermatophilus congolensis TaxID=1863 RepID=A0AA46BQK9_9MICO|nr:putative motility protein [Dermatophilus congolensis]MBO3144066.1 putative motility protein [Dermatophilus congolensis]MBO3153051.1 putative motility protein [Dermatophilus congolensis]MBO3159929.1 putative motility protein [Dermatophilus congolensis]MBO3164343.1 putative motility protein [Dermatophilus congolensis]MBO3177892.1 putative motility protein [Dermatophilus congolensis]
MDIALAQSIMMQRSAATYSQAQVSLLKKAMDSESSTAAQLLSSMPLATEGNVGRNINTYA